MPSGSAPDVRRDIIVIGGSAGAVEAVLQLARGFPPGFSAAVSVVIHTSPAARASCPD